MSRVRCAVLGSGFAGSTFAEAVRYAPDAELVAIAGGRKASELAALHGVRAVDDVDGLLDSSEVDAVLIASPNPFHCPQTVRAAASGKHVLVEKPMATPARCASSSPPSARRARRGYPRPMAWRRWRLSKPPIARRYPGRGKRWSDYEFDRPAQ
jgi:Oxidoreductase family, NAD-binding Rossmann fold